MVLLSSHFLEVLLKILLWWTALCTWKYMPTKSGAGKDSWILLWQTTPTCAHFSPGSTVVKSDLELGMHPGMRVLPDAHPPGSRTPLGTALGGICHLLWWAMAQGGRGSKRSPCPRQAMLRLCAQSWVGTCSGSHRHAVVCQEAGKTLSWLFAFGKSDLKALLDFSPVA